MVPHLRRPDMDYVVEHLPLNGSALTLNNLKITLNKKFFRISWHLLMNIHSAFEDKVIRTISDIVYLNESEL